MSIWAQLINIPQTHFLITIQRPVADNRTFLRYLAREYKKSKRTYKIVDCKSNKNKMYHIHTHAHPLSHTHTHTYTHASKDAKDSFVNRKSTPPPEIKSGGVQTFLGAD